MGAETAVETLMISFLKKAARILQSSMVGTGKVRDWAGGYGMEGGIEQEGL